MAWPVVLAAGRRRSAPLETTTPDANSFLDDGRMGVESSGKIMVQHCFYTYVRGQIILVAKIVLELVTHPT